MATSVPLAERMRPRQLGEVLGQEHLTEPGAVLAQAVAQKYLPSMILWGPPGVGKTTLALILAEAVGLPFFQLSAISAGVKDIREIIDSAHKAGRAILFIDEIHRFNKGQQDALLGAVEKGILTLIGATTENPSFEVNGALLSRCQVFVLKPLTADHLDTLLHTALQKDEWLAQTSIVLTETEALKRLSGGDARKLLNLLEITVQFALPGRQPGTPLAITDEIVMQAAQTRVALYDKKGEQHYDIISAFIKSIRGSDPNGAIYWLARMIAGGEDIEFIARRLVILASEDIGNANPTALVMANACFDAVKKIGYPEGRIVLSQCVTYLAASPKSNAAIMAIDDALQLVQQYGDLPVPLHLRNAPTKLMKQLDYGKNYQYSHLGEGNFLEQEYLPDQIAGKRLYNPGQNAREDELRRFLKQRWKDKYGY
jgi:putative ATPase